MIGKIQRVPLREVWKHEALDFTTWILENIDVLSDTLGMTLQSPEREYAAGRFSVDLIADDGSGNVVVIENQLEKSNHDHLGKLITYLAALNARIAVWLVSEPRPEHVDAISWLNQTGLANFYLLKVEAIKIIGVAGEGTTESAPAPLLTLITGPSEEAREIGDTKQQIAERYSLRREFWKSLLDEAKTKTKLHATISPSDYSWVATGAGKSGLAYLYSVAQHRGSAELIIDRGKDAAAENVAIFEELRAHRPEIEQAFGAPLVWHQQEGVRLCRVRYMQDGGYRDDKAQWPTIQDGMIDAMIRLEKSLRPFLQSIGA